MQHGSLPIPVLINHPLKSSKCSNGQKIQSILKKRELIITFKSLKGMTPEYMTEMFTIPENQTYQLRHNHQKLYLPEPKTNFLKQASLTGEQSYGIKLLQKSSH